MRATVLCMAALTLTVAVVSSDAPRVDRGWPVADSCPEAPAARYFPIGAFWPHTGVVVLTHSLIFYDHHACICLRAAVLNGFCSCSARGMSAPLGLKRFLRFPIQ